MLDCPRPSQPPSGPLLSANLSLFSSQGFAVNRLAGRAKSLSSLIFQRLYVSFPPPSSLPHTPAHPPFLPGILQVHPVSLSYSPPISRNQSPTNSPTLSYKPQSLATSHSYPKPFLPFILIREVCTHLSSFRRLVLLTSPNSRYPNANAKPIQYPSLLDDRYFLPVF